MGTAISEVCFGVGATSVACGGATSATVWRLQPASVAAISTMAPKMLKARMSRPLGWVFSYHQAGRSVPWKHCGSPAVWSGGVEALSFLLRRQKKERSFDKLRARHREGGGRTFICGVCCSAGDHAEQVVDRKSTRLKYSH